MNLLHDIPHGTAAEMNVIVEIPKFSKNKYEIDKETGIIALDRVMHTAQDYPFDYGFVPQTLFDDGDALDVCLLLTYPTFPGCVVKARAIGILKTSDEKGGDNKIIAVPVSKSDPRFEEIKSLEDLPAHVREEISIFPKEVKKLEKAKYDKVVISGFGSVEEAKAEIVRAMEAYSSKHGA